MVKLNNSSANDLKIATARVYDVAIKSPLEYAAKLSRLAGCSAYLKREDLQPVHSFKVRGAYNKIVHLTPNERAKGVIAASAGNHAQGVALAAQKLGISALIVMPKTTPAIKIDAVKSYGASIELQGNNYSEAAEYCTKRTEETGRVFIHAFDDPLVIAGQGTIGCEIIEQLPEVTHIFVPIGGGGLIAGIAAYVKALRPDIKIIGVEPADSNAMQTSVAQHKRVVLPHVGIFADGVAVKQMGTHTYPVARDKVDDFITVDTYQMCLAIKSIFEDTRSIVEPAGALAVAGISTYNLPKNAVAVAICTGANMTFERLQQVAERTLAASGREAVFAVTLPKKPGALQTFCAEILNGRTMSEMSYQFSRQAGRMLIALPVSDSADKQHLVNKLEAGGYSFSDLTNDDITKEHIRHMIGGASGAGHEYIYTATFSERPDALADFIAAIGTKWSINHFHYRSTASDVGNVLIGFTGANRKELERALTAAGIIWKPADSNAGVKLFLQ